MNLGYESGDQVGAFDEKKQKSKISCKCTFKYTHLTSCYPVISKVVCNVGDQLILGDPKIEISVSGLLSIYEI
jgi:hypothetical protein